MIRLETALALKAAGLQWRPARHDFFAIPNRQMDDQVFVIADMLVTVEVIQGAQMIHFQGASEWALDSLVTQDSVWLPGESQLRSLVLAGLLEHECSGMKLLCGLGGCRCEFEMDGQALAFQAAEADEAYAAALLHLLNVRSSGSGEVGVP